MVAQVKNHGCTQVPGCKVDDNTKPPRPTINFAIASAGIAPKGAKFYPNSPPNPPRPARDPAYIELANWEPGTKFQILNVSANPKASWSNPDDIITLEPTGRNVDARTAAVWVPHADMEKLDLDSGNALRLRVIDPDGNFSDAQPTRLQGSGYGQVGRIQENPKKNTLVAGSMMPVLDGEGTIKNLMLKHAADTTPPVIKYFQAELTLDTDAKGNVTLKSAGCLEDAARVEVMNGRTGANKHANVDGNQNLAVPLSADVKDGDTLYVTVRDNANNAAGQFEVRYSKSCKGGRGSTLGILAARLPGAIK